MASLDAAGVLHQAEYFPHEIDLEKVAAMRLGDLRAKSDWAEMAVALHEPRHARLRGAIHHALGYPAAPYPGRLPPEDSPGFGTRATLLTLALMRDGRPWPPVEEAEGKARAPAGTEAGSTRRFALLRRVSRLLG
jgi:hypothetical protein